MAKPTFYNLAEDKRQVIVDVAIDEFLERGFERASISQMVARAGIAKGSFYQYFEDKHDLFMYLVELIAQEKAAYFKDRQPPDPSLDFFALLRWMFEAGFEFNLAQPKLAAAVSRVLFSEGMIEGATFREAREQSAQMFTAMIEQAAARGELDPSIDAATAAFVVDTLINQMGLFILNQQQVSAEDRAQGSIEWLRSERARQIVDSTLRILEHGLRSSR
jgi:TetR/AcrR family transcriptional regulator